jgi:hypothetical protein
LCFALRARFQQKLAAAIHAATHPIWSLIDALARKCIIPRDRILKTPGLARKMAIGLESKPVSSASSCLRG